MATKPKTPYMRLKELRVELRYFQMQARLDARNLKASREKCKQIGAEMRECQHETHRKNAGAA